MSKWQYVTAIALFMFEAHTVTRPGFPIIAEKFINPLFELLSTRSGYLPFQTIAIIRRIAVSLFIAAAQIAPQFRRQENMSDSPQNQQQALNQLAAVTKEIDSDTQRMLNMETSPFLGDA